MKLGKLTPMSHKDIKQQLKTMVDNELLVITEVNMSRAKVMKNRANKLLYIHANILFNLQLVHHESRIPKNIQLDHIMLSMYQSDYHKIMEYPPPNFSANDNKVFYYS